MKITLLLVSFAIVCNVQAAGPIEQLLQKSEVQQELQKRRAEYDRIRAERMEKAREKAEEMSRKAIESPAGSSDESEWVNIEAESSDRFADELSDYLHTPVAEETIIVEDDSHKIGVEEYITDYNWMLVRIHNDSSRERFCHIVTSNEMVHARFFVDAETIGHWYPIGPVGQEYEWGCK